MLRMVHIDISLSWRPLPTLTSTISHISYSETRFLVLSTTFSSKLKQAVHFEAFSSLSRLLIIEKSILMGIPCLICYVRALYLFLGMYLVRYFLSLSSLLHRRNRRTLSRQRVFAFANGRKYLCLSSWGWSWSCPTPGQLATPSRSGRRRVSRSNPKQAQAVYLMIKERTLADRGASSRFFGRLSSEKQRIKKN